MPEIENMEGHMYFQLQPPEIFEPGSGRFLLLWTASGLKSAALRLPHAEKPRNFAGRLREGLLFLLPPGARLEAKWKPDITETITIEFSSGAFFYRKETKRVILPVSGEMQAFSIVRRLDPGQIVYFRHLAEMAYFCHFSDMKAGTRLKARMAMLQMLAEMMEARDDLKSREAMGREDRIEDSIQTANAAVRIRHELQKFPESAPTIRKRFRRKYGTNPKRHQEGIVLDRALYLILETDMLFKQVAHRLNFSSPSALSRFVRHHAGKTPRELRRSRPPGAVLPDVGGKGRSSRPPAP